MTDEKRKPGRPRKWSSDAERMRATRAAKRAERLADEERREVKRAEQERASREQFASSPNTKPVPAAGSPKTGNTWMAVHATCEANILKLTGSGHEDLLVLGANSLGTEWPLRPLRVTQFPGQKLCDLGFRVERTTGIEPASSAWKEEVTRFGKVL